MSRVYSARAAVAGLTARGAPPERIAAAQADLFTAKREAHLSRLVEDDSLPFTDADREHFARLLPPVSDEEAAVA